MHDHHPIITLPWPIQSRWTRRRPWALVLLLVGLLVPGCASVRDDRRALTPAEVQHEVLTQNAVLLATHPLPNRSVLFMRSPTELRCQISQIRDTGDAFGLNLVMPTPPLTESITILDTWDPHMDDHLVLCLAINDVALQESVTRVHVISANGTTTDIDRADQDYLIVTMTSGTANYSYTLQLLDATGTVLYTERQP